MIWKKTEYKEHEHVQNQKRIKWIQIEIELDRTDGTKITKHPNRYSNNHFHKAKTNWKVKSSTGD